MSNIRQQSPTRSVRRRRERHMRRLGLEALESRACPAVMFDFDGGVLNITGDEGPNVIELFQPRDRVVEVTGDGERRIFEGVDEVFVAALGGDDTTRSSKPKEIVVVASKINIDAGAGNDRVIINDGGPTRRPAIFNTALDVAVDLGTGIDEFLMDVRHHDSVNLDLTAEDGGDKILVGMLLPAIQKVRESAARMNLNLGGGGNLVDVSTDGFGRVDLGLAAAGGGNTVQFVGRRDINDIYVFRSPSSSCEIDLDFGGGGNLVKVNAKDFDGAALHLKALGGGNTFELNGHSTGALRNVSNNNQNPTFEIFLELGDGGNVVDVQVRDLELNLTTNTLVAADARPQTGSVYTVTFGGSFGGKLDLTAGAGDDTVVIEASDNRHPDFLWAPRTLSAAIDLGAGNNVLEVRTENLDEVDLDVLASGGNNKVTSNQGWGKWEISPASTLPQNPTSRANLILMGDGNRVEFNTRGYNEIDLDLDLTGNRNTVEIGLLLPAVQKVRDSAARIDLDVGGGSLVNLRLENIENVDLSLVSDPASPEPVTGGVINVYWHVINNGSSSLGRLKYPVLILKSSLPGGLAVPRTPDDSPATFSFSATAGGPDAPTSVKAALHLGPEDDTVSVLSRNVGELELDFSTGEGDDTVKVNSITGRITGVVVDPSDPSLDMDVDLGNGNDVADINTQGYSDVTSSVDAGAGNDRFNGKYLISGATHRNNNNSRLSLNALLGAGDDSQEIGAAGYAHVNSFLDAGDGRDSAGTRLYVGNLSIHQSSSQLNAVSLLGAGDDRLEFDAAGYADVNSFIDAGAGDDSVKFKPLFAFRVEDLDGRPNLNIVSLLGAGDDRLELDAAGYDDVNSFIDAGAGDDETLIRHKMFAIVDRTNLNLDVQLGLGSDTAEIESRGYRDFDTTIDTGPAGDGHDMVATSHVFKPSRGRVSRIPLTLDGGLDTAVFIAEGYDAHDVQPVGDTLTHEVGHWYLSTRVWACWND